MDRDDNRAPAYEELEAVLGALANANRLRILHQLLEPRQLTEIRLPPPPREDQGRPGGLISRQAVRRHLRTLLEVGLVHMEPGPSHGGGRQASYSLDGRRLFAIVEEIRRLGHLRPRAAPERNVTEVLTTLAAQAPAVEQPRFLVVHGAVEGVVLPLTGGGPSWTLGRTPDTRIPVDWDPYVSARHLVVHVGKDDGFEVENLDSNLNGTTLNFEPLAPGGRAALEHGDILGVGRSLLVFRTR